MKKENKRKISLKKITITKLKESSQLKIKGGNLIPQDESAVCETGGGGGVDTECQ